MSTKITHYVCPVCSGKSTMAQKLQNLDPEETLLIEAQDTTDLDMIYETHIRGCSFKKVIIDNFLKLYQNKKNCVRKIIKLFKKSGTEEIILFSTPDRLYDEQADKSELKKKFLDRTEVKVIQEEFYSGLSHYDRMMLTSSLPSNEFQSKVLGSLYNQVIS